MRTNNVVKLPTPRSAIKREIVTRSADDWRLIIQEELRARMRKGLYLYQVAAATNLNIATISKIIREETRFPRFHTIQVLMKYLGYELRFHKVK